MKFGKLLQSRAEELQSTGLTEHFLRYKALKKTLKQISKEDHHGEQQHNGEEENEPAAGCADDHAEIGHAFQSLEHASDRLEPQHDSLSFQESKNLTPAEISFIETLKQDLQHFNDFFIDKEEECIIRTQALEEQLAKLQPDANVSKELRSAFVDLHGEMVLLLHWSMLNYAAVVKILKKHDKNSGVVLRAPFLASVLKQPFYSTERITELVRDVEQDLQKILGEEQESESKDKGHAEEAEAKPEEDLSKAAPLMKRTHAALEMWKEMGDKASTPSTVAPSGKVAKTAAQQNPSARLEEAGKPSVTAPAEVRAT